MVALPLQQEQQAQQIWRPNSEQQTRFLASPADEALFGGAAGPGKTDALLMEALRQIENPMYRGILFRRVFPSLEAAHGLIDRSLRWYPGYGGRYNQGRHVWIFPSGARIFFGHMQHLKDMLQYQGAEYSYIAFDELTEFLEEQYLYMFSRARAPKGSGLRVYVRATTNPGNIGHAWVKGRFITRDIVNRLGHFARINEEDLEVEASHPLAKSRAFYPARHTDNPALDEDYIRNLMLMGDKVERARLAEGDWDAEHTEGRVFDNWSSEENVTNEAEYDPDKPIYWACDDGYVYGDGPGHANYHPRVVLFIQENDLGGPDIIDELFMTEETHDATIRAALEKPFHKPALVYLLSVHAMFRGRLTNNNLATTKGNPRVSERIKAVRHLILDGNGVRLLRVNPRCVNVIYEMANYRRDPKDKSQAGELVPLKLDDHAQEALGVIAWMRWRRK